MTKHHNSYRDEYNEVAQRKYNAWNMLESPKETTYLAHSRTASSLLWAKVHSGSFIRHVHVWLSTAGGTYKQYKILFSTSIILRNAK